MREGERERERKEEGERKKERGREGWRVRKRERGVGREIKFANFRPFFVHGIAVGL